MCGCLLVCFSALEIKYMLDTCSTRGQILPQFFSFQSTGVEMVQNSWGAFQVAFGFLVLMVSPNHQGTQVIFSTRLLIPFVYLSNTNCSSRSETMVSHRVVPAVTQHKAVVSSPHTQHLPCSVFSNWGPSPASCATSYPGISISNSKIS